MDRRWCSDEAVHQRRLPAAGLECPGRSTGRGSNRSRSSPLAAYRREDRGVRIEPGPGGRIWRSSLFRGRFDFTADAAGKALRQTGRAFRPNPRPAVTARSEQALVGCGHPIRLHDGGRPIVRPRQREIIRSPAPITPTAMASGFWPADDHVPGHREQSNTPDWKETFPDHCAGTPGRADRGHGPAASIEPSPEIPGSWPPGCCPRWRPAVPQALVRRLYQPNLLPVLDALSPDRSCSTAWHSTLRPRSRPARHRPTVPWRW